MTAELKSLAEKRNAELIELLEAKLAEAKLGEIVSAMVVTFDKDGTVHESGIAMDDPIRKLGAMTLVLLRFAKEFME